MNTNKLKSIRVSNGLTQEDLAKRLGMTTKTYNRKELAIVDFSRKEILNVSLQLGLSLDQVNEIFFDGELTVCIS